VGDEDAARPAAAHADELRGRQQAQRLAQRGPADPELVRQLLLGADAVARAEVAFLEVAADLAGDLLARARRRVPEGAGGACTASPWWSQSMATLNASPPLQQAIDDRVTSLPVHYDALGVPDAIDVDRDRQTAAQEMAHRDVRDDPVPGRRARRGASRRLRRGRPGLEHAARARWRRRSVRRP
jgi:hypothetical protein